MENITIIISIVTAIGGGALGVLINVLAGRKKQRTDIATSNINDALKLKEVAMNNYVEVEERIDNIKAELKEVEEELYLQKQYALYLIGLLTEYEAKYKTFKEFKKEYENN